MTPEQFNELITCIKALIYAVLMVALPLWIICINNNVIGKKIVYAIEKVSFNLERLYNNEVQKITRNK